MTDLNLFELTLPPTVHGYLRDPAIRTGVNALLDVEPDALPPDLALHELGDYYAARAAAELTRYDWADTLYQLWTRIWHAQMGSGWVSVPIEELISQDCALTPEACWDQNTLNVCHRRSPYLLYSAVEFDVGKTSIAFSIETETGNVMTKNLQPFTWYDDDEWQGWLVITQQRDPADPDFRLGDLQAAANMAIAEIERLTGVVSAPPA